MGVILRLRMRGAAEDEMTNHIFLQDLSPDASQHSAPLIVFFLVLQLIGLFGSIITILSARFSSPIKRHPTWYNFIGSWIISSISYTLLLFAGNIDLSGNNQNVPFGLCVVQSAAIYAAPPFTATATLGLVVQIWFNVHLFLFKKPVRAQKLLTKIILTLPYILLFGICAEALAFGLTQPDSVRVTGSGMYCNSGIAVPGRISAGIAAVVLLPAVIIEIAMVVLLRKHWAMFQGLAGSSRVNMLSMMFRVFVFSIFGIFALGLSLFFTFTIHHGAALNIVVSFIPVAAVFVFGSQKDLLKIWMFWKWKWRKENSSFMVQLKSSCDSTIESPVSVKYYEKDLPPLPVSA
ncbi:hypothetical protein GYMLUDRAFT_34478 [Collybiopsis luxurians FD-317 M1]|nr:hypothetical protein GYMLUDRAFT_34478 [Collybiopsis luxurians FD-317 M1]